MPIAVDSFSFFSSLEASPGLQRLQTPANTGELDKLATIGRIWTNEKQSRSMVVEVKDFE